MKKKILLSSIIAGTFAVATIAASGTHLRFNTKAEAAPYSMALTFEEAGSYKYLANWEIGAGSFTRQTANGNNITFSVSGMEEMWGVFAKAPDTGANVIKNTNAISGISKIAVTTAFTAAGGGYEIAVSAESDGPSVKYAEKNTSESWVDGHTKTFELPVNANYFTFTANSAWIYSIEVTYSCVAADASTFNAYANKVNVEKESDLVDNLIASKFSVLKSKMLYGNEAPDGRDSVLKVEVESDYTEWPRFTLDLGKSYNLTDSFITIDSKYVTSGSNSFASIFSLLDSNGNPVAGFSEANINVGLNTWSTATVTASATDVRYIVVSYWCTAATDVLYLDNLQVYANTRGEAIEFNKVYQPTVAKTGKFYVDVNFTSEHSWNSRFQIIFYDWDVGGTYSRTYEIEGNRSVYECVGWTSNPIGLRYVKDIGSYYRFEVDTDNLYIGGDGTIHKIHAIQIAGYGYGEGTAGYIDVNAK